MVTTDVWQRPLGNLRISVTDRCNLRCDYCMPEEEYVWLARADILRFEEIAGIVDAFALLGNRRVRLTGGEPLLRRDLHRLVAQLAARPTIDDLALTTNGVLLAEKAADLRAAGLHRVTVSLDTLRPDRFRQLARRDELARVLAGIDAIGSLGWKGLKLDTVVMRGVNDDELADMIAFGRDVDAEVRFIEYMDVGGATRWSREAVVPRMEILERLERACGRIEPIDESTRAPAERFRLADGTTFGIIASTTAPFCGSCDRSRITADGVWYLCLYAPTGIDLRGSLRSGASTEELARLIAPVWSGRRDRGAEERLRLVDRLPLRPGDELRLDPHLEMHTRGG